MTAITEHIAAATGATDVEERATSLYGDHRGFVFTSPDGRLTLKQRLEQANIGDFELQWAGNKTWRLFVAATLPCDDTALSDTTRYTAFGAVPAGWVECLGNDVPRDAAVALCEGHTAGLRNEMIETARQDDIWMDANNTRWAWLRPVGGDALNPEPAEGGQVLSEERLDAMEGEPLRRAALMALRFIGDLGEHSPVAMGGEAEVYEALRSALYPVTGGTPPITDMPSVWASEHAAVVAQRDAAQAELATLRTAVQTARTEIREYVDLWKTQARGCPAQNVGLKAYRDGKADGLEYALAMLPNGK